MRIYVGAKFESAKEASALMSVLESRGHVISYDWTKHETEKDPNLAECASNDLDGVLTADLTILLWHPHLKGGLIELGAAMAKCQRESGYRPIVIGCPTRQPCVFFYHPMIAHVENVVEALAKIGTLR